MFDPFLPSHEKLGFFAYVGPMNPLLHTDRPEFFGIDAHFQTRMMPALMKHEAARKIYQRWGVCVAILLVLPSLWLSWYFVFQYDHPRWRTYVAAPFLPVIIPFLGFALVMLPSRLRFKKYLMENMTAGLGWTHKRTEKADKFVKNLKGYGVLPRHNQRIYGDRLEGHHLHRYFKLRELILLKYRWGSQVGIPVFQGLTVSFQLDRITPDTTIIARGEKPLPSWFGRERYYSAEYEDAQGTVHILSTDPDVLSTVMCLRFRSAIADLEARFPNTNMACLLIENQLHITMKARNMFEIGALFDGMNSQIHVQKMLNEFGDVLKLLDILLARRRCPKTGAVDVSRIMSSGEKYS